jgi:hypothetical protein
MDQYLFYIFYPIFDKERGAKVVQSVSKGSTGLTGGNPKSHFLFPEV